MAEREKHSDHDDANLIAAVDLGSNSFHMVVARLRDDQFEVVDRLREAVRLGSGIDDNGALTPEIQERALESLARFGQRLSGMAPSKVRAVGTNALRRARNGRRFLARAQDALGHAIDIVSGVEEARLIHLGVVSALPNAQQRHLVIDIGGGSTELIVGEGVNPIFMESVGVGCVNTTVKFFDDGNLRSKAFEKALLTVELEFEPVKQHFLDLGWKQAVGASGTIRTIERVAVANGWSESGITRSAVVKLRDTLIAAGHVSKLKLSGLSEERVSVLAGGTAILCALFETLKLDQLQVSERALREGLLCDLEGRIHHTDVRARSIAKLMARYDVDTAQAERVKRTALVLLDSVAAAWKLGSEDSAKMLEWAASVHEIGLAVAHSQYHKHGAYLVENSDVPGFTRQEQQVLAAIISNHRRKFDAELLVALPEERVDAARKLVILLRLAVLLHRSRSRDAEPPMRVSADKKSLRIEFGNDWLHSHPLTDADLQQEVELIKASKIDLIVS